MRLIDADKITDEEISKYLGVKYASCTEDVKQLINDQPTITLTGISINKGSITE